MDVLDAGARRLVVAANRGPVSFQSGPEGEPILKRGLGGLVTVLNEVLGRRPGTWVAAAVGPEEAKLAEAGEPVDIALDASSYRVRYVSMPPEVYDQYDRIVANPMLWFLQHYLWDLGWHPDITLNELNAWVNGYLPAQQLFAAAVVDEVRGDDGEESLVMLHDHHLYGVAPLVRAAAPRAFLHQFVHIPWPQSDAWTVLPKHIRTAVFEGLLGNDIVSFHTRHNARNFLQGCADLLDLPVDWDDLSLRVAGREVWARAYPVSIDPKGLREAASTEAVAVAEKQLLERRREFLLLRVDRLDLSKNVIRGFRAFDRFLELHPEYRERITFLALLQPARADVEEYVVYRERVMRTVAEINAKHGNTDWRPIEVRVQDDYPQTLAAYKHYDALMVNSIFDGMNLIAKEGPVLNTRDGVLILSENTGAAEELHMYSVIVNPFDIEAQAAAIHEALTISEFERRVLAQQIRRVVDTNSIERWVDVQFTDIGAKLAQEASAEP